MVNFGLNAASILGICLAVAGAALYFLRSVRPELARDHDIFFAAVGLLCGFILLFQGWRLDPILQFGQLLLTGTTVFFAVESIRLRGLATKQAKQNTPIVDDERPVSRVYRTDAFLDEIEPIDDERPMRRIRGTRDTRSNRADDYDDVAPRRSRTDEYEEENPRRYSNRGSGNQRLGQGNRASKRTNRSVSRSTERPEEDEWGSTKRPNDDWEDTGGQASKSTRGGNNSSQSQSRNPNGTSRPRKRTRPSQDVGTTGRQQDESATSADNYVDYKPVDHTDEELDNSAHFDDL